jgi:hypothetical protein
MFPVALAIGAQAIATGLDIYGGYSAASEKKKAARRQAKFDFAQRMEQIRRDEREQAFSEGTAMASAGASNVLVSGSTQRYIQDMQTEHARQIAYSKGAAHQARRNIRKGGDTPGLLAASIGKAASGLSSAVMSYNTLTG